MLASAVYVPAFTGSLLTSSGPVYESVRSTATVSPLAPLAVTVGALDSPL